MGLLRNMKRNKLKDQLLNQAKLESYEKKFSHQIETLEKRIKKYLEIVQTGKQENDMAKVQEGMYYTEMAEKHMKQLRNIRSTLEVAKLNIESQDAYEKFVNALKDFSGAFKENDVKSRDIKKSVRKFKKGAKHVQNQIAMIEKRVNKIQHMTLKTNDKKTYQETDIEQFMKDHKLHD